MNRLRDIRGNRTLAAMARAAGLDPGNLSRIERGQQMPRQEQAARVAEAYGIGIADVYASVAAVRAETENAA